MAKKPEHPLITLLIPCYNESSMITPFLEEMQSCLPQTDIRFEFLFVNDGSTDDTLDILKHKKKEGYAIRIIDLSRNFGKEASMTAGLIHAHGDAVIPIDCDLQDPPSLIAEMIKKWQLGYDVVLARRTSRKGDGFLKRFTAGLFYKFINRLSDHPIPEQVGDFRLMDRKVVDAINQLPERQRFMKGLFSWVGFKTTMITFERPHRHAGESKFSFWKLWNFALEGITSFTSFPLKLWSYVGGMIVLLAFIYAIWIITKTLYFGIDLPGYASIMTVILFLGGIQLISLGIIGEYIGRIYTETKQRPCFIIEEIIE